MVSKIKLTKMILLVVGMVILIQPAKAYISPPGQQLGSPAVGSVALKSTALAFWGLGHPKHSNGGDYPDYHSQENAQQLPPDGASIMLSSVPVIIQSQVSKNIFTANIPNVNGGYSTVILQREGNRFIELPGESYPDFPRVSE